MKIDKQRKVSLPFLQMQHSYNSNKVQLNHYNKNREKRIEMNNLAALTEGLQELD